MNMAALRRASEFGSVNRNSVANVNGLACQDVPMRIEADGTVLAKMLGRFRKVAKLKSVSKGDDGHEWQ